MAGVLIRMKLAILRRAYAGPQASYVADRRRARRRRRGRARSRSRRSTPTRPRCATCSPSCFAMWTLGWVLAPAYGGAPVLRPEHFALQPVPRRRLALGLLGAAFVGVPAAVTLARVRRAARVRARGSARCRCSSRCRGSCSSSRSSWCSRGWPRALFGALSRSRAGGAVSALITAVMLVAASSGWIVFVALDAVLDSGFSDGFCTAVRALPSSWARGRRRARRLRRGGPPPARPRRAGGAAAARVERAARPAAAGAAVVRGAPSGAHRGGRRAAAVLARSCAAGGATRCGCRACRGARLRRR